MPALEEALAEIERRVSEERGLTETGDLVREFVSPEELSEIIAGLLSFGEETEVAERVWKLLGLIGTEDSLADAYTESYQSSVVGFFQPAEDRIVVVQSGDGLGAYAELVYAHEYVHALQYGTYDIGALEEAVKDNSDADTALTSLIEGDASLLQQRYFRQHLVHRLDEIQRTLDSLPEGPDVPAAVTDSLIFPYVAGPTVRSRPATVPGVGRRSTAPSATRPNRRSRSCTPTSTSRRRPHLRWRCRNLPPPWARGGNRSRTTSSASSG